jgi:flagellum-specific ATP synthase
MTGAPAPSGIDLAAVSCEIDSIAVDMRYGRVTRTLGVAVEAEGPAARIGELCHILLHVPGSPRARELPAEVVGFSQDSMILMPFGEIEGLAPGTLVRASGTELAVPVGPGLLGRILDALGRPIDGLGEPPATRRVVPSADPPDPVRRPAIERPLPLGIRAVDALNTIGYGQRIGIFAGSGVGKSTLLSMAVKGTAADVCVVALIGERGREVREFVENDLGEIGLARSVVVAVPSSESPILRLKGAFTALAIAESFRDSGRHVLLVMDSLTRFAMARREVGLAIGEPPTSRGYPVSVYSLLPRFLERAGTSAGGGSITGLYTVLVEGDDLTDPVADAARGLLDGHLVLSRHLAGLDHYPALDVLASVSRLMGRVVVPEHHALARKARQVLARYAQIEDSLTLGTYVPGTDPARDRLIARRGALMRYLRQDATESAPFADVIRDLEGALAPPPPAGTRAKRTASKAPARPPGAFASGGLAA